MPRSMSQTVYQQMLKVEEAWKLFEYDCSRGHLEMAKDSLAALQAAIRESLSTIALEDPR